MGFGILLFGYFCLTIMAIGMGNYDFAAYIIGGVCCLLATVKLWAYKHNMIVSAVISGLFIVSGIMRFIPIFCEWVYVGFPFGVPQDTYVNYLTTVNEVLGFALIFALLIPIYQLAVGIGIERIKSGCVRQLILHGVLTVIQILFIFIPALTAWEDGFLSKARLLLSLVVYVMTIWLFFRCYQLICPVGEETGRPEKKSRFAFINRISQSLDEKQQRLLDEQSKTTGQDNRGGHPNKSKNKKKKR